MMKKKVKKIPKYSGGIAAAGKSPDLTIKSNPAGDAYRKQMLDSVSGASNANSNLLSGIATASNELVTNVLGIEDNSREGVTLNAAATGSDIGGSIMPGWGHLIGGIAGGLVGSFKQGSVDPNTGEITYGGIFGRSNHSLRSEANRIKNNIRAKTMTQNIQADYYNNPNVPTGGTILAAEGGIMRKPVEMLVSPGEIRINPYTLEYKQYGDSNEEPNTKDNKYDIGFEKDIILSHAPHMKLPNGKTVADNGKMILNANMSNEAKIKNIKKLVNWQEQHRTKPQEYAKFDNGGIAGVNKYGYNKNMSDFAYWDKDKNEYKKEYLDWVNNLTEQDVRDIESGKYGDMSEYFSKNKGKKLDVATAQKLMTDKKYGNWHKIGQAVVDNKIKNTEPKLAEPWHAKMSINGVGPLWQDMHKSNYPIDYNIVAPVGMKLKTLPNPSAADGSRAARKYLSKQNTPNWLNTVSDFAPMAAALFGDYDYHTELAQISPAKYIPTGVSIDPIRRAADESYAMARYNQANISPNTGAGMAYGLQAASNRTKSLADAYVWQQDAQNKLIAQNAGIYNDWAKRYDAARYQAIADTRANEGAAQQMRDQAIKDAYEFQTGRRNDRWKLSMLEPLMKYAVDDNIWKNFKIA